MKNLVLLSLCVALLQVASCGEKSTNAKKISGKQLNIPAGGIESLMEANTSKIIEGNAGSVIITIGEVTRKKADITIKRNDRILDERLMEEHETMDFEYEGIVYEIELNKIKKPLIGAGKAEIRIRHE